MAYSYETSSVKTINGEVSGLADVVARQALSAQMSLSAGEGINFVEDAENHRTRIDLGLSAGSNMSFVYDQETNTYRLDAEGGGNYSGISPIVVDNNEQIISADVWDFSAGNGLKFTDDNVNKVTRLEVDGNDLYSGEGIIISSNDNNQTRILLDQEWLNNQVNLSNYYKKTETSSKTELANAFNNLNIDGLNMSASTNIDMFESGGYIVISANGGGSTFPITGTNGTTGFTANMDCSSMMLTTGASPAGGYVKQTTRGVQYEAYPATDVSASWYNIITATNNRSNCYCIRFTNDMTAASLEDYSAYDKVTVVHSNEYTPDCMLYWDGNTKVFPSGLYCELVKGTNDQNQTDWFFTTSGWINNLEWDWD